MSTIERRMTLEEWERAHDRGIPQRNLACPIEGFQNHKRPPVTAWEAIRHLCRVRGFMHAWPLCRITKAMHAARHVDRDERGHTHAFYRAIWAEERQRLAWLLELHATERAARPKRRPRAKRAEYLHQRGLREYGR